jgi:formamidopyrimidine-DNA glycosylase
MPELPEVETTLRGIQPFVKKQKIKNLIVRHPHLRWPIPSNIKELMIGQKIVDLERRGKYILFKTSIGTAILHLGMSGRLRVLTSSIPAEKHDHIDIEFENNKILRLTDPRRFGAFLWTDADPSEHELLKYLGPEPLSEDFNGHYLWQRAQRRKVPVKSFIMDSKIVVGVGNIYAAESLFAAGIHPETLAGKVSEARFEKLVVEIKKILQAAIEKGGTTLKDFLKSDGKPGYFSQQLKVYGRAGLPCVTCEKGLKEIRLGQRSTVFCVKCQKK